MTKLSKNTYNHEKKTAGYYAGRVLTVISWVIAFCIALTGIIILFHGADDGSLSIQGRVIYFVICVIITAALICLENWGRRISKKNVTAKKTSPKEPVVEASAIGSEVQVQTEMAEAVKYLSQITVVYYPTDMEGEEQPAVDEKGYIHAYRNDAKLKEIAWKNGMRVKSTLGRNFCEQLQSWTCEGVCLHDLKNHIVLYSREDLGLVECKKQYESVRFFDPDRKTDIHTEKHFDSKVNQPLQSAPPIHKKEEVAEAVMNPDAKIKEDDNEFVLIWRRYIDACATDLERYGKCRISSKIIFISEDGYQSVEEIYEYQKPAKIYCYYSPHDGGNMFYGGGAYNNGRYLSQEEIGDWWKDYVDRNLKKISSDDTVKLLRKELDEFWDKYFGNIFEEEARLQKEKEYDLFMQKKGKLPEEFSVVENTIKKNLLEMTKDLDGNHGDFCNAMFLQLNPGVDFHSALKKIIQWKLNHLKFDSSYEWTNGRGGHTETRIYPQHEYEYCSFTILLSDKKPNLTKGELLRLSDAKMTFGCIIGNKSYYDWLDDVVYAYDYSEYPGSADDAATYADWKKYIFASGEAASDVKRLSNKRITPDGLGYVMFDGGRLRLDTLQQGWLERYIFRKTGPLSYSLDFGCGWPGAGHDDGAAGAYPIPEEWWDGKNWDYFLNKFCKKFPADYYGYARKDLENAEGLREFLGFHTITTAEQQTFCITEEPVSENAASLPPETAAEVTEQFRGLSELRKEIIEDLNNDRISNNEYRTSFSYDPTGIWAYRGTCINLETRQVSHIFTEYPNQFGFAREERTNLTFTDKNNSGDSLFKSQADVEELFNEELTKAYSEYTQRKIAREKQKEEENRKRYAIAISDELSGRMPSLKLTKVFLNIVRAYTYEEAEVLIRDSSYCTHYHSVSRNGTHGVNKKRVLSDKEAVWLEQRVDEILTDKDASVFQSGPGGEIMRIMIEVQNQALIDEEKSVPYNKYHNLLSDLHTLVRYGSKTIHREDM